MGSMYAWATPNFMLDYMSLEEVFFYYVEGVSFEGTRAQMIINKLAEALEDPKKKKQAVPLPSDRPDKKAFYKRHGSKIKRPPKEGE